MKYTGIITVFTSLSVLTACTTSATHTDKLVASPNQPASASNDTSKPAKLVESYTAHISDRDKVDEKGKPLKNARDILLQDRKNYYDFNLRDQADTPSKVFAKKENRWSQGKEFSEMKWEPSNASDPQRGYQWKMRRGVEYQIFEGNPDVKIQVYDDGNIHVDPSRNY